MKEMRSTYDWIRALAVQVAHRPQTAAFVVGCQRSGTTMLLNVLARSPDCRVFHENRTEAFDAEFRLRDDETIQRLIRNSAERVVAFKPLLDSQRVPALLALHPRARAVWIYRHYRDAVGSAVRLWGGNHRDLLAGIATDTERHPGQASIRDGLTPELLALLRSLSVERLSDEDGSLLHWYVRNRIYLTIADDPRVLLVKYGDLIRSPAAAFRRVFNFVDCPFSRRYVRGVHSDSVGKHADHRFNERLRGLSDALLATLDARSAGAGRVRAVSRPAGASA